MPDNVTLNSGSGGAVIKTDDDGTAHWQYVKLAYGPDNTQTRVTASAGLPVGDAGGSLTVDNAAIDNAHSEDFDTDSGGTDTTSAFGIAVPAAGGAVAVNGDSSGLNVHVVDSVGANQIADAAAAADGVANPTVGIGPAVTPMFYNGMTWDRIRGTTSNGLDVDVTRIAPGTGQLNLGKAEDDAHASGDVGVMALAVRKATPANLSSLDGDYEPLQVSVGRLWVSATVDAALPAGTNAIGKLAANDGVDIGDVTINNASGASAVNIQDGGNSITVDSGAAFTVQEDGAALTALQLIDDPVFADDAAFTLASSKVMVAGAIRDDTLTTLTAVEGDAVPLRVSSTGALHVTGGGGGTEYTEDAVAAADPVGGALIMVRDDAPVSVAADGDNVALRCTQYGAAYTQIVSSTGSFIDTFGGGTQYTEDDVAAANPVGTQPVMVADSTPALEVAEADVVAQRATRYGAAYCQIVDSSGNFVDTFGGSGGTAQADESTFTEGTTSMTPIGGVLNDTITSDPTEDQAAAVRITAKRAFHVNPRDVSGVELFPAPAALGDATANPTLTKVASYLMGFDGVDWNRLVSSLTNGLEVDVTRVQGVVSVDDNAGNLSIDFNGTNPTLNTGTVDAGTLRVTLATDVSVPVAPAGTGEFHTISAFTRNEAFSTKQSTCIGGELDDTTTTAATEGNVSPARITAQRGIHVNLRTDGGTEIGTSGSPVRTDPTGTTTQPVSDASGSLTVDAPVGTPVNVQVGDGTNTAGVTAGGLLKVDVLSASVTVVPGAQDFPVVGGDAHDAAVTTDPVLIAARANNNEPTAVSDADVTHLWADLLGRLVVLDGHANPEAPVTANGTASGTTVIAAPGAGVSLYIKKVVMFNSAGTENIISLRDGAAGTIRFTGNLAADGGGCVIDFGSRGWKLTANTALVADIGSATGYVNVTEYYIAA